MKSRRPGQKKHSWSRIVGAVAFACLSPGCFITIAEVVEDDGGAGAAGDTSSGGSEVGGGGSPPSSGGGGTGGDIGSAGGANVGGAGGDTWDCAGTSEQLFFDDFEHGEDCWSEDLRINPSDWSLFEGGGHEETGYAQGTLVGDLRVAVSGEELFSSEWDDIRVEAWVKVTDWADSPTDQDIVGLFARYDNRDNFYYVGVRGDASGNQALHLRKRVGGSNSSIGSSYRPPGGFVEGSWYRIALEVEGDKLRMFLNGSQVGVEETDGQITGAGYVAIGTIQNVTAVFDDVTVTRLP